ncbi:AAA family ATPase [Acinetobacter stercoris]|uniref:Rad50/SbcC-type AAA domain-containing protein n=1 Tax=Acinetobacter stercoris TaxID=2126983 RepID=A0A2U3MTT5_9GAMM|nr:AAA family ATPase [Acinetobacter stercoris]SPL68848.1 hypothetical protein KPC_0026 [Acinetobacter stercoris]
MKIKSIHLSQTFHFSNLKVEFDLSKPVTLILGHQAAGKTAIIKNIYQALTWYSARLKDMRTAGVVMLDQDIRDNAIQSKIVLTVKFPAEIGQLPENSDNRDQDVSSCSWKLYKTLNTQGMGLSKVETTQLEQLIHLYQQAIKHDPLQGLPMIAYYPSERFVNETNLLSKNNPGLFQVHAAYEVVAIPFTTYARFFEWFREVSDIENAQTAQLFQHLVSSQHQESEDLSGIDLHSTLFQAHAQLHAPSLKALKTALNTVFPEITDIYLEYQPKLQLMVCYKNSNIMYQQLSNTLKSWVALIGDVVRRLCILNPLSLYPCLEGDGILLIDHIDAYLDSEMSQMILARLNQAFPQVQIIATGNRSELLENAEHYQCLRLENKNLSTIHLQPETLNFDEIYNHLMQGMELENTEILQEPDTQLSAVEQMFHQIQNLNDEQQQLLRQLLQNGDDTSSHEHLT